MTYARWWRASWSLVIAVGMGVALLQMSGTALFAVALLGSTAAAVILVVHGARDPGASGPEHLRARDVGTRAVRWGALVVATYTVIDDSPPIALLVALVAATSCPPVVRLCRAGIRRERARRRDPGQGGGEATTLHESSTLDDAVVMVRRLSDADLCELWRTTFWELHEHHTGDERLTLVTLRQTCLDELGRRNPEGLRAWLSSGARASSSPDRFLHPPHPGTHDAA